MKRNFNWNFFCLVCFLIFIKLTKSVPLTSTELKTTKETFLQSYTFRMKSLMNTSVSPCDDFYSFACGNYPNIIENLETTFKRSNMFDINLILLDQLDTIVKKVRDPKSEEYFEELEIAKKFVDTCANSKLFPIEPSEEYLKVIKDMGGFPAIDPNWNESAFDWFNMTAHLTRYGIDGFVKETISSTYPFKPFYKIPKLGFGFDVYHENIATNKSEGYVYNEKIMRNLLEVYKVSGTKADQVIEGVFELLRQIEELQAELMNLLDQDVRNNCQWLSAIQNLKPSFEKWRNLFKIAWGVPEFSISYESYCPCDWFYNKLDLLAKQNSQAFANYMAMKFLFAMHPQLESTKFQRRQCMVIVKEALPTIFTHFFMKEHYNKKDENDISEMIVQLKTSWKNKINTADWLDDAARAEALEKLENLQSRIGQFVDPISDVYIRQIKHLNPTDNLAANTLQLAKFKVDMRHYGYLNQNGSNKTAVPYDFLDAVIIRAFYLFRENNLNLIAGIFHPPLYHKDFPNSIKYATLGYIIAHEIGHGFVGNGFQITSNAKYNLWLSEKSNSIAEERSNCFEDDYNNFVEPVLLPYKLNGKKALSEIEADSVGLRQAFEAYERFLKEGLTQEDNEYLSGLNMSQKQIFFLAFAQLHCSKYEPKHYWADLSAAHPLDRYRVLGTLRNFDEFSKAFMCPAESPMNPSKKCQLW